MKNIKIPDSLKTINLFWHFFIAEIKACNIIEPEENVQ